MEMQEPSAGHRKGWKAGQGDAGGQVLTFVHLVSKSYCQVKSDMVIRGESLSVVHPC